MDKDFEFKIISKMLNDILDKTLGEIDVNRVFDKAVDKPKITGIAGDVIEQSVLKLKPDSKQSPDILIDGEPIEVKTTGIRISKKGNYYEAKEPMSITAVTPEHIVNEDFDKSHFWDKSKKMLLVYYEYAANKPVPACDYAFFRIKGYDIYSTPKEDEEILKSDWLTVKNFIKDAQLNYKEPENEYYKLSSEINKKLVLIDTAPKWPHRPRFRFKRSYVSYIVQKHFGEKLEKIPGKYVSYSDIEKKCLELEKLYGGKTVGELCNIFNIPYSIDKALSKSVGECIIVKMFGGNSKKINKIELFQKFRLIGKTITVSTKGSRTEDMKLFGVNFDEWTSEEKFEDSYMYDFFTNYRILCIKFKETVEKPTKLDYVKNVFAGFEIVSFDQSFVENEVKKVWIEVKNLISNNLLKETVITNKDGSIRYNKCGTVSTRINFPKSKDNIIFLRGGGINSQDEYKTECVNGIKMYHQSIWIKGSYVVKMLNKK